MLDVLDQIIETGQVRASREDWEAIVQAEEFSDVMRMVHLIGRMDGLDQSVLADRLYRDGLATAEAAIEAQMSALGVAGRSFVSDAGFLETMRSRADWAAASITNTYDKNLALQIAQIRQDVPTANRWVYAHRLFAPGAWDTGYWASKADQVAEAEDMFVLNAAVEEFWRQNSAFDEKYVREAWVVPFAAVCPVCNEYVDGNPYKDMRALYDACVLPAHLNCLVPGQKVFTAAGLVNVEEVRPGDWVVTPEGTCQVIEAFQRHVEELIYCLEVGGRVLRLTGEHPVLTRTGWLSARDLQVGEEILVVFPESVRDKSSIVL